MPLWQASNNGLESTQYLTTSALNRSNNFIISTCPFWQAIKRGVKKSAVESLTLALLSKRSWTMSNVVKYCVDSNPLFEACHNGMDDVVKILLENGADVNFQRNDGATALFIACEMNYRTIVRLLLSYGADVNHRRDNKSTPL
jgi:hypothetical protein